MRSIPPVLLAKIKEQNQTIWNDANPKMSINVARAKSTVMDSSYWTVETIRQKEGLGDISVAPRRFKSSGPPNRIYEIHVDNGIVGTAIREYPDKLKQGWQNQFSLGPGSKVAIAFDGEWHRFRKLWRLVTHEKPWIFWVDNVGDLYTQYWDDESTKILLASNVVYCRAIRAWKTLLAEDRDQGIVVGYIKTDGKVYYRQYIQYQDLSYSWGLEYQINEFVGTATNLNLFITNDYRMGFIVADNADNISWYVTNRNYSAMSLGLDTIDIKAKLNAFLDIGEIETLLRNSEDIIEIDVLGMAILGVYEEGQSHPTIEAMGEVIDERTIKIAFNVDSVRLVRPEYYKYIIPDYDINAVVVDGNVLTITTNEDIDTLGFTTVIPSGILIWAVGHISGFINNYSLKIEGFVPPVYETISISPDISFDFNIFEIIKYPYDIYPQDIICIEISKSSSLTLIELGTDPV